MKPAILRELKDRRVSLIAYSGIAFLTLVLYMSLYPTIHASLAKFESFYSSYPKEFYQAFGIENFSLRTLEGYLAVEHFSIVWPVLAIFFAASRAANALAGEIEKGVMSFYLMLPISRTRLYIAKYTAFLLSLAVFILLTVIAIIPLAGLFGISVDATKILHVAGISLLFAWALYAVSLCLSAIFSERSKVYMIMGGGMVIMYVMLVISGLQKSWEWLQNYTVFYYYNAQDILSNNTFKPASVILFGTCIVAFSVLGLILFRRRDIAA